MAADYDEYSIIYGCDTTLAGAVKFEWMWVLSRTALSIGSAAWNTRKDLIFSTIESKLPDYDPEDKLRPTI